MGSGSDDGVGGKVVGMDAANLEIKEISEVEDKDYWINKIGNLIGVRGSIFLLSCGTVLFTLCAEQNRRYFCWWKEVS